MDETFGGIGAGSGMPDLKPINDIKGGVTGHFAYTPHELATIINDWDKLAKDYQESLLKCEVMTRVKPPANEIVSERNAWLATEHGQAYVRSLKNKLIYCLHQKGKMQDSLNKYLGLEDRGVDTYGMGAS